MKHLVDTTHNLGRQPLSLRANCGLMLTLAQPGRRNDWGKGECREWLDSSDVCDACREEAMKPKTDRYTFEVSPQKAQVTA